MSAKTDEHRATARRAQRADFIAEHLETSQALASRKKRERYGFQYCHNSVRNRKGAWPSKSGADGVPSGFGFEEVADVVKALGFFVEPVAG